MQVLYFLYPNQTSNLAYVPMTSLLTVDVQNLAGLQFMYNT